MKTHGPTAICGPAPVTLCSRASELAAFQQESRTCDVSLVVAGGGVANAIATPVHAIELRKECARKIVGAELSMSNGKAEALRLRGLPKRANDFVAIADAKWAGRIRIRKINRL